MKSEKGRKVPRLWYLLVVFITLIFLCGSSSGMAVSMEEDSIEKPTWKVGDQWSMGYTVDLNDYANEMKSSLGDFSYNTKINNFLN